MHPGRLLAALLVLATAAQASISIVSPRPGPIYSSGESILLAGYGQAGLACTGSVSVLLDGNEIATAVADFQANAVVDLATLFPETRITATAGSHVLKVASQCLGEAEVSFSATSGLDIIYTLSTDRLMVGDTIRIQAYAFSKEPVHGITYIYIGNGTFLDSADWTFTEAGQHSMRFVANDTYGNYGERTVPVTVSDQLAVNASADKASYKPGEVLRLTISASGAFGGSRIIVPLVYAFGKTYEQAEIPIPEKAMAGTHVLLVEARNGSNSGKAEVAIFVEAIPSLRISLPARVEQGDLLNVTAGLVDQSGIAIPSDAEVTIKDRNGTTVYSATVQSNDVRPLAIPELMPGTYDVSVSALNETAGSKLTVTPAPPKPAPGMSSAATGLFSAHFSDVILGIAFVIIGGAGWYFYESKRGRFA
jgi:hypothetical protein